MTDIVERLRHLAKQRLANWETWEEAADEIERLRAAHAFAIKVHDVKMKGSPARWSEPPEV